MFFNNKMDFTEIPISNSETLEILQIKEHKLITKEFFDYLKENKIISKYPLNILRELKKSNLLESDLISLTSVSNTNYTNMLNESDSNMINQHFNISN
jgi:hypothetical protein